MKSLCMFFNGSAPTFWHFSVQQSREFGVLDEGAHQFCLKIRFHLLEARLLLLKLVLKRLHLSFLLLIVSGQGCLSEVT